MLPGLILVPLGGGLVLVGSTVAAVLEHAGIDPLTAAAHGYALSFAVAAGVTGFGTLLGFFGITRPIAARPAEPGSVAPGAVENPQVGAEHPALEQG